ncbi:hypothetical protein [Corallococcus exiguus]|uniref:Uncharacterized protein n=1 Tax=Corallococcus exiguus TaxID=83462 RepID=A0A7X5BSZ4_9BACT|nr:hypothetical protein [Corallococcus exiguus]NBC42675.1 hypothetical protein [Corallococcus exiguus]TNV53036.1 hypothetical protein FH620_36990 [Corallococcus exiguus]
MASTNKKVSRKELVPEKIWGNSTWTVRSGQLIQGPGRPGGKPRLFTVLAEKIPYEALNAVRKDMEAAGINARGVYVAHDSMGYARYVGRGEIFQRLKARKRVQELELAYFSFYVVAERNHEREIETLLIRAASPLLAFNDKKKHASIYPGNIRDYEPGTSFYERHYKKGKKISS